MSRKQWCTAPKKNLFRRLYARYFNHNGRIPIFISNKLNIILRQGTCKNPAWEKLLCYDKKLDEKT